MRLRAAARRNADALLVLCESGLYLRWTGVILIRLAHGKESPPCGRDGEHHASPTPGWSRVRRAQSFDQRVPENKVVGPPVASGMKQRRHFAGQGIYPGQMKAF